MIDPRVKTPAARGVTRRDLLKLLAGAGLAAAAAPYAIASDAGTGTAPLRFAILGDFGDGSDREWAIAERMAVEHARRPFDLVVTAGDNIYPDGSPKHFAEKFEQPFERLISQRVPFYACLGNHDVRAGREAQLAYPLFNMSGRSYYRLAKAGGLVEFFVLDSNAMDRRQLAWLDASLAESKALWKVPVFHHPIYSSGKRHGSDVDLRASIEPIFVRQGVRVAFSGHEHFYQRVAPQQGIQYFITGGGGQLREGNIQRDGLVAAGNDAECHFMVIEADARRFAFRTVNCDGATLDAGEIHAREPMAAVSRRRFAAA